MNKYTEEELHGLVHELTKLPNETEWVEFKHNNGDPQDIGEYISALANSASLEGKINSYLVWGVDNNSHQVIGTTFNPQNKKMGNEELENWLLKLLKPKINFTFYAVNIDEKTIVILEIQSAYQIPVQFSGIEYIRIGSYKKKLKEFPEKERELWRIFERTPFEKQIAKSKLTEEGVLELLDYPKYFELTKQPLPNTKKTIISSLEEESLIKQTTSGKWEITNLGAILFAKNLSEFSNLQRMPVRVIIYKGKNKMETLKELEASKQGYAVSFKSIVSSVEQLLPAYEDLHDIIRKDMPLFPLIAIRELIANAMIHQDFYQTGTSITVEIFSDRIEITNPGVPLVKKDRFIDTPPKSRNESLASFMRRIGICEERGSGFDKVVFQTEINQLPAPIIEITDEHTRVVLFAYREYKDISKQDRLRACYFHACLKYVERDFMTNTSLRERFGIAQENSAMVSRVIKEALQEKIILPYDEEASRRYMKYIPFWAK